MKPSLLPILSSVCAVTLNYATPGFGQALMVLPVNVDLSPDQRTATLTVTNAGAEPTAIQVRMFRWEQVDGEDHLTPSDDVMTSPPIAAIPAGASQIVRLVLRTPDPGPREATYRVLLDQIPTPATQGSVKIALRLSIPIFVAPPSRTRAQVDFKLKAAPDGTRTLVASNAGDRHETLRDLVVTVDGAPSRVATGSPYVLAGASRRWEMPTTARGGPGAPVRVTAMGLAGPIDLRVATTEP